MPLVKRTVPSQVPTTHVKCPRCGTAQKKRQPDAIYYCERCRGQFDDDPDEGGDWSDRDPSWRLERQERRGRRR